MLTILTACYNGLTGAGEESVRRCLESVAKLPFPHEHLIMDGMSKDGSAEFIRGLNLPGVSVYEEKDTGIYDALNKGLAKAKGDYIYVLGLDDYIEHPEAMARVYEVAQTGDSDIVISPVRFPDGFICPRHKRDIYKLYYKMPFTHQGVMAKKQILDAQGGYDASYRIVADYKHLIDAVFSGCKVYYLPEQYATQGRGGISVRDKDCLHKEALRLYKEIFPNGNEHMVEKGILTMADIVGLMFSRCSKFARRMGLRALKRKLRWW